MTTTMNMPKIPLTAVDWDNSSEDYVTHAAKLFGLAIVELFGLLDQAQVNSVSKILDAGAGAGALTFALAEKYPGASVLATDISPAMLRRIDAKTNSNVQTKLIDWTMKDSSKPETDTLKSESFDLVGSSFMLQYLDTPADVEAVHEFARVAKTGGAVAVAIWGPQIPMAEIFQKACRKFDHAYSYPDMFTKGAMYSAHDLEKAFKQAGLSHITTKESRVPLSWLDAKGVRDLIQNIKNPAIGNMRDSFPMATSDEFWDEYERIVLEEYDDGKLYAHDVACAVGFKQ